MQALEEKEIEHKNQKEIDILDLIINITNKHKYDCRQNHEDPECSWMPYDALTVETGYRSHKYRCGNVAAGIEVVVEQTKPADTDSDQNNDGSQYQWYN